MFVTFLSDFGLDDEFVGVCHGVIRRIAPDAAVIDITHGIPPRDIRRGSLVLAEAIAYMPPAVHLAVVDPGVGGSRRAVVVESAEGFFFVGPDNGLLLPAAERAGAIRGAFELTNPDYALAPVSSTFHGRDVFSPAAAHLARGIPASELGPPVEPASLIRLERREAASRDGVLVAVVAAVDRFGNARLDASPDQLVGLGPVLSVEAARRAHPAVGGRTFADAESGEIIVFVDSSGSVAVAVSGGDAADLLGIRPGDEVRIRGEGAGPA